MKRRERLRERLLAAALILGDLAAALGLRRLERRLDAVVRPTTATGCTAPSGRPR